MGIPDGLTFDVPEQQQPQQASREVLAKSEEFRRGDPKAVQQMQRLLEAEGGYEVSPEVEERAADDAERAALTELLALYGDNADRVLADSQEIVSRFDSSVSSWLEQSGAGSDAAVVKTIADLAIGLDADVDASQARDWLARLDRFERKAQATGQMRSILAAIRTELQKIAG
jgi:hypothetical protein